ncbi:MAG: DUF2950 family protein [Acidobacteria bacterium]|nr:DUF2950 family protein [Acidobacteriota bacterium]
MRFYKVFLVLLLACVLFACAKTPPSSPLETLKAYTAAIKKKDTTTMKSLLSDASIKMAQQEAKAQNVMLDDIVKRETLFSEGQTTVEIRNQKIEGDKATIEVKNSFNTWDIVPFVKEDSVWKIDKQSIANQMMQGFDEKNKELDNIINQGGQP